MSKLFHSIVGYGIALTAVIESGAACGGRGRVREGHPPPACNTASPCQISGIVVDSAGNPVANVTVTFGPHEVKSGADGKFEYSLTDTYGGSFEAVAPDNRRGREPFNFHHGGPHQVTIKLEEPPSASPPPEPPQPQPVT